MEKKIIDENTTENIHVDERQMSPYQDESSHFPMGSIDDIMPGGRNSLIAPNAARYTPQAENPTQYGSAPRRCEAKDQQEFSNRLTQSI
ncbi:hypothetical protein OOU_Y34scaffold00500g16 [Pyricularia oryzae Y34]|uniref:Uncharacterized protein n=1 Tax=Pyricularia oryzae (strain Y34) TaxID=1143189 RepID=A0AA97NZQ0_PYRO3|nr:hypothetical protein OOU_Y34scaffold00500g16 [Pyricularia oryzae Y34]